MNSVANYFNVNVKIRIGSVLKSTDVRTQVSSRYSENSSHTHPHTTAYNHTQPRTTMYNHTQLHPSAHIRTNPCTSAHICAHPCTKAHILADGLNLINYMKLHVNRPNTKKARKKIETKLEKFV